MRLGHSSSAIFMRGSLEGRYRVLCVRVFGEAVAFHLEMNLGERKVRSQEKRSSDNRGISGLIKKFII